MSAATDELDRIAAHVRYRGAHDYWCPTCQVVHQNVRGAWLPVSEETRRYKGEEIKLPTLCPTCQAEMEWLPPDHQYTSLFSEHVQFDLGTGPKRYSSLRELRAAEAETHRKARDGIGSAVSVRALNQNRSNKDVNSLKGSEFERARQVPVSTATRAGKITARAITEAQAKRA